MGLRSQQTASYGRNELPLFNSGTINYTYDGIGNRLSMQSSFGNVNYDYNSMGQLATLATSWGESYTFSRDTIGRLAGISRGSAASLNSIFGYEANSSISSIEHYSGSTKVDFSSLTRDPRNFISSKSNYFGTNLFVLDSNAQLVQANNAAVPTENEQFSYDDNGNRVSDLANGNYQYDTNAQLLVEDSLYSYAYDDNGNLISKISKIITDLSYYFSYNSKNQLVSAQVRTQSPATLVSETFFKYDPIGRRIYKKVKDYTNSNVEKNYSRHFIYDKDEVIAEVDATNGSLLARYSNDPQTTDNKFSINVTTAGVTAKIAKNTGSFYYLKDNLGSTTSIANATGSIVQRYQYSTFGVMSKVTDSLGNNIITAPQLNNRYTYSGREFDQEIGLMYYRARYYDPKVGRFIQEDPFVGSVFAPVTLTNRYIYVTNNPQNFVDPSGEMGTGTSVSSPGGGSSGGGSSGSGGGLGGDCRCGGSAGSVTTIGSTYSGPSLSSVPSAFGNVNFGQQNHLANAVQYVSLFVPELNNATVKPGFMPLFDGATWLPSSNIWINKDIVNPTTKSEMDNLINTVYHEALHFRDGGKGWWGGRFGAGHRKIENASGKFVIYHQYDFYNIYYGITDWNYDNKGK